MYIREASDSDLNDVLYVERLAFGHDEEAELVRYLLDDSYDFTVIAVTACLKEYLDGTIRQPGLWMMGHIVSPDRLFDDMETMGVRYEVSTTC